MSRYSRLDWTGRDYTSVRADVLALIARVFPDFTKTNAADPEMTVFEVLCYISDLQAYYADRQANEAFLATATERQNVIRHLAAIGYRLSTASPSTATLTFTLARAYSSAVTFPQGGRVTTEEGDVGGELSDLLEIAPGSTTGDVDWIEGDTVAEDVAESDASASQSYQLGQTPFIWESEVIVVDGIEWTRVDDFLSSAASDQDYVIDVDAFDQATVRFGDGVNGAIPGDGALIAASYRIGGGKIGNLEADTIKKYVGTITAADGTQVEFTVTNAVAASDGEDRETTLHGKLYGPKQLATNNRAVTNEDYETLAEKVAGVARALAQTSNEDTAIAENTVHVQTVPDGSGTPTQLLLDAVEAAIVLVKGNTTRLRVLPAIYLDLAIVGTVYLRRGRGGAALQAATIEAEADAILRTAAVAEAAGADPGALDTYFDADNIDAETLLHTVDFGQLLPLSDLMCVIRDAGEVSKYVVLTAPAADTSLSAKAFPRLRAYTKAVLTSPNRVEFTWAGLGTKLVVREEP